MTISASVVSSPPEQTTGGMTPISSRMCKNHVVREGEKTATAINDKNATPLTVKVTKDKCSAANGLHSAGGNVCSIGNNTNKPKITHTRISSSCTA